MLDIVCTSLMIPGAFINKYRREINMEQFYLGADVSKGYTDFILIDQHKQPVEKNFQLDDTAAGHVQLYDQLNRFFDQHPDAEILAAVESTGGYENNWYNALLKFQGSLNIKTARLNPEGVYCNSKADLKRTITDKVSALSIAEYQIAHPEKIMYQQEDYWAPLRKQWSFVSLLTKQKAQLFNQLETLIYTANPEILQYCQGGMPQWVLKLLKQYPTAAKLSRARITTVVRIPYMKKDRAEKLIAEAKNSIASAQDNLTGQLVSSTIEQILQLEKSIKAQTKILADNCSMPEIKLLKTYPGISDYSAIGLMLELQTIERFPTAKKLASFIGVHPVFKASGDGSTVACMSKKGRKVPRKILFMVVLSAITCNPLIRDLYKELLANGKEKMAAIGVCMHKTLRILYGMLKNNTAFDPEIDKKNQSRSSRKTTNEPKNKNRRYQEFDAKAPVSRRQRKKRTEQKVSQSATSGAECGINASAPESSL
jgi:transposase